MKSSGRSRRAHTKRKIIVVDDCSTDGTRERLKSLNHAGIVTIFQEKNQEGSDQARIAAATGDIILIQDADLEYDPAEYPVLIDPS